MALVDHGPRVTGERDVVPQGGQDLGQAEDVGVDVEADVGRFDAAHAVDVCALSSYAQAQRTSPVVSPKASATS